MHIHAHASCVCACACWCVCDTVTLCVCVCVCVQNHCHNSCACMVLHIIFAHSFVCLFASIQLFLRLRVAVCIDMCVYRMHANTYTHACIFCIAHAVCTKHGLMILCLSKIFCFYLTLHAGNRILRQLRYRLHTEVSKRQNRRVWHRVTRLMNAFNRSCKPQPLQYCEKDASQSSEVKNSRRRGPDWRSVRGNEKDTRDSLGDVSFLFYMFVF